MPKESLRLSELLCSRLCHDLIAPVSALNTGLELLQENNEGHHTESEEILKLILHSAQTAAAKLSFFRVAFSGSGKVVSLNEIKKLTSECLDKNKIAVHWGDPCEENFSVEGWGSLFLNCLAWICECAPRGGEIYVEHSTNCSFILRLKTESILVHEGCLEALQGHASIQELTPRNIPCYLIRLLAQQKQADVKVNRQSAEELVLQVQAP